MRHFFKIIFFLLIFSSCSVNSFHSYDLPNEDPRYRNFFQLGIDDIIELGQTEISYEFSRYFFIYPRLISINGEMPDNSIKRFAYPGNSFLGGLTSSLDLDGGGLRRALYNAYVEFPEADYMHISSSTEETHRMFLGRKIKRTSIVKAYKFRDSN